VLEKRKFERSKTFLIVNFRKLQDRCEYSLGITDDISQNGVRFESSNFDHPPGKKLELVLRHPHSAMSVSTKGEIVWKKDSWYECVMGIKLKDDDNTIHSRMAELISYVKNCPEEMIKPYEKPRQAREQKKKSVLLDLPKNPALTVLSSDMHGVSITKKNKVIHLSERKKLHKANTSLKKPVHKTTSRPVVQAVSTQPQAKMWERQSFLFITLISIISLLSVAAYMYLLNSGSTKDTVEANIVPGTIRGIPAMQPDTIIKPQKITLPGNISIPEKIVKPEQVVPVADLRRVITFDFESTDVSENHFSKIDDVVTALHNQPASRVIVEGHADNMGPAVYNLDISMRRARAVKKLLMEKGIERENIKIALFGATQPVASNESRSGRMSNRRVEVIVTMP